MRNINSLKNSSQFSGVYEGGKSFANRLLVVYVLPADDVVKLGISVSKKVGNSIVRHRVTRLIRESYLNLRDQIPYGNYIVVIARSAAKDKTQPEIEEAMKQLLKKHKLIGTANAENTEENKKKNCRVLIKIFIAPIKFYKKYISGYKGYSCCKYTPTCSQYAIQAIEKYGPLKGLGLAIYRVLRCNPFSKGGYDPVP